MRTLTLSILAVTLMFLAPHWVKAERFEAIPAAITDSETGLMWLSQPCCIYGNWEESDTFTAGLDYAGYQDWRTPTIEELEALFEAIGNPSNFPTETDHPIFDDMQRYYWTATPYRVFDISNSTVFYDDVNPYWIWPVRTAFIPPTTDQPIGESGYDDSGMVEGDSDRVMSSNRGPIGPPGRKPSGKCCTCNGTLNGTRWCDNGNGTVTDMTTCLVWLKKADWGGMKPWRNPTNFDDAHTRAGTLKAGTAGADLSDKSVLGVWRLPNKSELHGLVTGPEPVRFYEKSAFTGVQSGGYWTSTTHVTRASDAWYVRMRLHPDQMNFASKALQGSVWPVRSGN